MKTEALNQFAEILQLKVNDYYLANYRESFLKGCHRTDVKVTEGKKYIRIDVGDSGKFMLDTTDNNLYFIKGYGTVDKKKCFGELSAIVNNKDNFHFDGYSLSPLGKRSMYGFAGKLA